MSSYYPTARARVARPHGSAWRSAVITSLFLALGACTSADYVKPTAAFGEAAKAAQAALVSYEKTLDDAALEANIAYALAHRGVVRAGGGSCLKPDPQSNVVARCTLVIRDRPEPGQSPKERSLTPDPATPHIHALMGEVVTYGTRLAAIAEADTEAAVKAATDQAKASAIDLAKAGDALAKVLKQTDPGLTATVSSFASPVADAVLYGLGKYVESLKVDALRKATKAVDPIFPKLTELFGATADQGMTIRRNALHDAYLAADLTYTRDASRSNLAALRHAAEAYDSSLTTNPKTIFENLRKAHHALTEALASPKLSFESLWPHLQDVVKEAEKIAGIAKSFKEAVDKQSGT